MCILHFKYFLKALWYGKCPRSFPCNCPCELPIKSEFKIRCQIGLICKKQVKIKTPEHSSTSRVPQSFCPKTLFFLWIETHMLIHNKQQSNYITFIRACQKNFFLANFSLVWIPIPFGTHRLFWLQDEWKSRPD